MFLRTVATPLTPSMSNPRSSSTGLSSLLFALTSPSSSLPIFFRSSTSISSSTSSAFSFSPRASHRRICLVGHFSHRLHLAPSPGAAGLADHPRRPCQRDVVGPRGLPALLLGYLSLSYPPAREQRHLDHRSSILDFLYSPNFPYRFYCPADALTFCDTFFVYYYHEHRHSVIGYHTPTSVHYGPVVYVRSQLAKTLNSAYAAHPFLFRHRLPQPLHPPNNGWINEPLTLYYLLHNTSLLLFSSLFRCRVGRPGSSRPEGGHH